MTVRLLTGDCRELMAAMEPDSIDACVTDPPYHLTPPGQSRRSNLEQPADKDLGKVNAGAFRRLAGGFMGQTWDGGDVAFDPETWAAVYRVLKPGAHLLAFSGTRTYHRMVCAIEDAGFEIRDQLAWVYGSGFPKSLDVSKAIEAQITGGGSSTVQMRKAAMGADYAPYSGAGNFRDGTTRAKNSPNPKGAAFEATTPEAQQWQGFGTALKPAHEPICLARKPLAEKNVAANVLAHGTGALNIDGCRIGAEGGGTHCSNRDENGKCRGHKNAGRSTSGETFHGPDTRGGRWPANFCHDGSEEVLAGFPQSNGQQGDVRGTEPSRTGGEGTNCYGEYGRVPAAARGDSGSAARFFYSAKASKAERGEGNSHPTVKPIALMRWLCRLITPPGGTVLDPFAGSGSTLLAADAEQFHAIGCELSPEYAAIAERRLRKTGGLFAEVLAA